MPKDLKALLKEIFDPEEIKVKKTEDGITATLTGVSSIEWDDFESIEDEYLIEAWMFFCYKGGELILHLQELEGEE